jgi:uncharacterized protein
VNKLRSFVKNEMETLKNKRDYRRFRDRYKHTKRVLEWARRIHAVEGGDFTVIEAAVWFHDIGWEDGVPHALVSARIAEEYLTNNYFCTEEICNEETRNKIINAVKMHSYKELPGDDMDIETRVLIDADNLDELGATLVIMDSITDYINHPEESTYRNVYKRIYKYYSKLSGKDNEFKTNEGLRLYKDRMEFLKSFLDNLEFELGLDMETEKMKIEKDFKSAIN